MRVDGDRVTLSPLSFSGLAGHDLSESRPAIFRRLLHRRSRRFHLWRGHRVVRALSHSLPEERLYLGGIDLRLSTRSDSFSRTARFTGEPDVKTYLGRPWRDFSNVIYLNTEMSDGGSARGLAELEPPGA